MTQPEKTIVANVKDTKSREGPRGLAGTIDIVLTPDSRKGDFH
jgi:hypothetical protein